VCTTLSLFAAQVDIIRAFGYRDNGAIRPSPAIWISRRSARLVRVEIGFA
jgi:hypothetical protein